MKGVRRRNRGPARRSRYGALFAFVAVIAFAQGSASAQLKLPELPLPTPAPLLNDPLNLEDLLNVDELLNGELPVSVDLGETVDAVTGTVTNVIDGNAPDGDSNPAPSQGTGAVPQTGSWATDRIPTPTGLVGPTTRVSSQTVPPVSYGSAISEGFARAARRAADLAGPVAAPMILGLFAVGLLFVAARGPGRLVKVEEERKAFRDQRTFRL
ncbi:MAG: hypothetical protein ACRDJ1_12800 [Actinomycetota bacterium]